MNKPTFSIRFAEEGDAKEILEIYSPYILNTPITFEEEIPSEDDFKLRINKISQENPYLVCEEDGVITGYAYASEFRSRSAYRFSRELSIYMRPSAQGKGIARGLYQTLFRLLELQNVRWLIAVVTLPNEQSVKFHEHLGFRYCGAIDQVGLKFGQWHKIGWWQLELPFEGRTKDWISFDQLKGCAEVLRIIEDFGCPFSESNLI